MTGRFKEGGGMVEEGKKGIVSFDMDMTLLDHKDWQIPASAKKALEKLRARHYIVIATGRDMDAKYSEGLLEMVRPDAVIHLNGTKITVGGELIYEHRMDPGLVKGLLEFTEGKPFAMGLSMGAEDYFMNPQYVVRHDQVRFGRSDRNFQDPWKLLGLPVRTMAYIGGEAGARQVEKAFPQLKLPMFASRKGADVVEKEASKAEGMKRVCEYFGVPFGQTVAFGDSMNDYEVIRAAGVGVAMGNGDEELKRAADYVTANIEDDGVWNACVALHLF